MEELRNEIPDTGREPAPRSFFRLGKRKKIAILCSVFLLFFTGFFVFAKNYEIPLPFDAFCMSVETAPYAAVTEEDGSISWIELDQAVADGLVPEDYENAIDVLHLVSRGINGIGESQVSRVIDRDGQKVRVVYYCYTKPLWNSLFIDSDLQEFSESSTSTGGYIYGEDQYEKTLHPETQTVEIYYLPRRNLLDLNQLSDEEYDKVRETTYLTWSGTVGEHVTVSYYVNQNKQAPDTSGEQANPA